MLGAVFVLPAAAARQRPAPPWALHATVAAPERYSEIDLHSDGTFVEHGGESGSRDDDCARRGRITSAQLRSLDAAVRAARASDWRSAYALYAQPASRAPSSPAAAADAASAPLQTVQAYVRLTLARREYRTMVEFAGDATYRNDAPHDLLRVLNAIHRPISLCRPDQT